MICRFDTAVAAAAAASAAAFAEEVVMVACCCWAVAPELAKLAAVINGCRVALAAEAPEASDEATTWALDARVWSRVADICCWFAATTAADASKRAPEDDPGTPFFRLFWATV